MTRFILFFAAALTLSLTACTKEKDAPENCVDGLVVGQYGSFVGTYQPSGGTLQVIPDSQTSLKTVSVDCDRLSITFLNSNSVTFEANCQQAGNVITGASDDGKGTFTLNTSSKKMSVTYQDASGGKYQITALKES